MNTAYIITFKAALPPHFEPHEFPHGRLFVVISWAPYMLCVYTLGRPGEQPSKYLQTNQHTFVLQLLVRKSAKYGYIFCSHGWFIFLRPELKFNFIAQLINDLLLAMLHVVVDKQFHPSLRLTS